jgi:hypothetical protein
MDMLMISRVLRLRRTLRRREHWSEQDLREHQRREAVGAARVRVRPVAVLPALP